MEGQETYESLRDAYNQRTIKLCTDLYRLTNNPNFKRMADLIQHDIDTRQPVLVLWKHIDRMKPEHTSHVLEGNTAFFESDEFTDERADGSMIREFQTVWKDLSPSNKKTVFTKLQNIFRIAERVRQSFFDAVLAEAVM